MKRILIAVCLTASLLTAGQVLRAAEDAPAAASVSTKRKQMPFYGKVTQVDTERKTVTLAGKEKDRVLQLTDDTRIHDSGESKELGDVELGRMVGGLARANAAGAWEVVSLNLGVKQTRGQASAKSSAASEE